MIFSWLSWIINLNTSIADSLNSYKSEGFDNFICSVVNTYADENVLDSVGNLDYGKLKPVLFEFPTYSYLATGEFIGKCLKLDKEPSMSAKLPMSGDSFVCLSIIEVHPQYLTEYMEYAVEVGEVSLRTEPGVLTMYAVAEKTIHAVSRFSRHTQVRMHTKSISLPNISGNINRELSTWSKPFSSPTSSPSPTATPSPVSSVKPNQLVMITG